MTMATALGSPSGAAAALKTKSLPQLCWYVASGRGSNILPLRGVSSCLMSDGESLENPDDYSLISYQPYCLPGTWTLGACSGRHQMVAGVGVPVFSTFFSESWCP